MIIRSFLTFAVAASVAAGPAQAGGSQCGSALPNWTASSKLPAPFKPRPLNVLSVGERGKLAWNGMAVSERNVRQFLRIIRAEMPENFTALVAGKDADCRSLVRVREMMNQELRCGPASCVQVIG